MARGGPGGREDRTSERDSKLTHPLRPWVEAGWIFKDDEIIVIERQGDKTRSRKVLREAVTG
jgi:hypothetical protein